MSATPFPKLLTARPLMICVVLGALAVGIVAITRVVTIAITASLPWLSFPAPLPWFVPVIMATLLVRRSGAALIIGFIGLVGGGGMVFIAAVIVELFALPFRSTWRLNVWWAMAAGVAVGIMSFGFMFMFPEFTSLPAKLIITALVVRIATGAAYGALAFYLARKLQELNIGTA